MAKDYVMPKLAMAMNEGTIVEWLVEDGAAIEQGQPLLVVETEKVAYELEAPESGLIRILTAAGDTVPVEERIAVIAGSADELPQTGGESEAEPPADNIGAPASGAAVAAGRPGPAESLATAGGRIKASPLARKLAKQYGLDLSEITGTGPGGRIVKRDVLGVASSTAAPAASAARATGGAPIERVRLPLRGTPRASIARHMLESLQSSAQLSSFWESDITELKKTRQSLLAREKQLGTRVSVNAFIIRAMAAAIAEVPIANAALVGEEGVIYESVNVGIAIALPGKTQWDSILMVPVLRQVEKMGIVRIDQEMKRLVSSAREGTLTADEMSGSTITLSSTAGLAPPGAALTPILNMPNAVIIGPSTPRDKFVPVNGEAELRTMMPVSMTFDHRVLDGEPAARFASALHRFLENPALMLA